MAWGMEEQYHRRLELSCVRTGLLPDGSPVGQGHVLKSFPYHYLRVFYFGLLFADFEVLGQYGRE